jgi:hypothetical protein
MVPVPPSCVIQVRCARSFESKTALMKSPAKRLVPVQSAAAHMAPLWTVVSTVVVVQVGEAVSALNDSAQTTDQVELGNVGDTPLSEV